MNQWENFDANQHLLSVYNCTKFLVFKSEEEFSVEEHFGCRGRDTGNINYDKKHKPLYSLCDMPAAGIQTVPRVTATKQESAPVCDPHAPPVALPSGTYVQFDPHRALYSKQMFWALPFFNEEKFEQIWILMVQKILQLNGNRLVVHSPGWQPLEKTLIREPDIVNRIVNDFTCKDKSYTFCFRTLLNIMVDEKMVDTGVLSVFDQWHQSLAKIGYNDLMFANHHPEYCLENQVIFQPVDYTKGQQESALELIPIMNIDEINKNYYETCQDYWNTNYFNKITLSHPWTQFPNILLLVVFNNPFYQSIPFVEILYRPFFPHILYCGPVQPNLNIPTLQKVKSFQFSFYQYRPTPGGQLRGSYNYECMVNAINMHYPVEGILFLADDLSLAPANIKNFQHDSTWFVPVWDTINDDIRDPIIHQWGFHRYKQDHLRFWDRIEKDQESSPVLQQCFYNLIARNGDTHRVNGGFADLYYIPRRITQEFAFLGSIFLEQNIFLEIAVPTIIQCLDGLDNVDVLDGEYRNENNHFPWMKFVDPKFKGRSYLHRTKWSFLAGNDPHKTMYQHFYCNRILPWVHDADGTLKL